VTYRQTDRHWLTALVPHACIDHAVKFERRKSRDEYLVSRINCDTDGKTQTFLTPVVFNAPAK